MDRDEIETQKRIEWKRLIKKISQGCPKCDGLGFIPYLERGQKRADDCPNCIPKAQTITYLKDSGMNIEDIKNGSCEDMSLLQEKGIFLQGEQRDRLKIAHGILKEEAKKQRKVLFMDLPTLLGELKQNKLVNLIGFHTIYVDGVDLYKNMDQFVLPYWDGLVFSYKNDVSKRIHVGGLVNHEGYGNRYLEIMSDRVRHVFLK